jgi:tRNA U54 and U55 pseudouridine synthase Pus10
MIQRPKHWQMPLRDQAAERMQAALLSGGMANHLFSVSYDQFDVVVEVIAHGKVKTYRALVCSANDIDRTAKRILDEQTCKERTRA